MPSFIKKNGKFMRKNKSSFTKPYHKNDHTDDDQTCFNYDKKGHFIAEFNRPKKDEKKPVDRRWFKDDRRSLKKKKDQRVLVAEESKSKWADSDSEQSSSKASSNESEDETVKCLMADAEPEAGNYL